MTGATPVYALPYPTGTDRLDAAVTTIPQALALQIEATLQAFGGVAAPASWVALSLSVGAALGSGYATPGYAKTGVVVEVKGTIVPGAVAIGTTLAVLPVGFRPAANRIFTCYSGTGPCRVDVIAASGIIQLNTAVTAGQFLSLDSIRFRVDG